jgi:hypothetical protein
LRVGVHLDGLIDCLGHSILIVVEALVADANLLQAGIKSHIALSLSNLGLVGALPFVELLRLLLLVCLLSSVSVLLFDLQLFQAKLFLLVVEGKVIEELGTGFEAVEDAKHSFSYLGKNFLAVTALTCWFVVIQRILNMDELSVGDILYLNPLNGDGASPLA